MVRVGQTTKREENFYSFDGVPFASSSDPLNRCTLPLNTVQCKCHLFFLLKYIFYVEVNQFFLYQLLYQISELSFSLQIYLLKLSSWMFKCGFDEVNNPCVIIQLDISILRARLLLKV